MPAKSSSSAGVAGLCAAVYARRCSYQVEVLDQHDVAGGLATSWRRGDYTFETCMHWLLGSNPDAAMYAQWQEVFDIGRLTFVNPEEYVRLETEHGERLSIYTNLDRMETELLTKAPQDEAEIRRFAGAARRLATLELPDPSEGWPRSWLTFLRTLPYLPLLRQWSSPSSDEYGKRFTHPLLRSFFGGGELGQLSALALVLPLAWMSQHNAGYPIGGSQAITRLIVERLLGLGGHLRLGAKVERILVDRDAAVGVQLVRCFHFDPTFALPGKTTVTCILPTYNFEFCVDLQQRDPAQYQAKKYRVAEAVIALLERSVADVRRAIEVIDVSTPATVVRYTGNWKGSMEGWLLTPSTGLRPLRSTLPGLRQFLMVGQWVMPGGGLPSGLMTARSALQAVCKQDRVPFAA